MILIECSVLTALTASHDSLHMNPGIRSTGVGGVTFGLLACYIFLHIFAEFAQNFVKKLNAGISGNALSSSNDLGFPIIPAKFGKIFGENIRFGSGLANLKKNNSENLLNICEIMGNKK